MGVSQRSVQVEAILSGLRESHVILTSLISELPEDVLNLKRGKGFWSIAEHAAHLAEVQSLMAERIRRIMNEDVPEFVPFIPAEDESCEPAQVPDMKEVLHVFREGRDEIVDILSRAGVDDWNRLAVHPEYTEYGLFILARHILMHDHWHMYRMEELWLTRDEYLTKLDG